MTERTIHTGDIVQHFKRETLTEEEIKENKYLYKIIGFAEHTETGEKLVVYQALYGDFGMYARPYEMFMGKVDKEKYPDIKQEYRFERIEMKWTRIFLNDYLNPILEAAFICLSMTRDTCMKRDLTR